MEAETPWTPEHSYPGGQRADEATAEQPIVLPIPASDDHW